MDELDELSELLITVVVGLIWLIVKLCRTYGIESFAMVAGELVCITALALFLRLVWKHFETGPGDVFGPPDDKPQRPGTPPHQPELR